MGKGSEPLSLCAHPDTSLQDIDLCLSYPPTWIVAVQKIHAAWALCCRPWLAETTNKEHEQTDLATP